MRSQTWLIMVVWLLFSSFSVYGQEGRQGIPTEILRNSDVLTMVKAGLKPGLIISKIVTSHCNFDIFPPVLQDLKRRGVPDAVLQAMTMVPNGPPNLSPGEVLEAETRPRIGRIRIPAGTSVEIETAYPVSSADVEEGGWVTFLVVQPVYVNGVLTIARGAVAKAKIVKARKAQTWGRPGSLYWQMDHVVALDGSRVPLQLSDGAEGDNRAGQIAAGVAISSAIVFPYTAPVALVFGLQKGNDAVLRGSRKFTATVSSETEVVGLVPESDRIIYHYAEALKTKMGTTASPTTFPRHSVKGSFGPGTTLTP